MVKAVMLRRGSFWRGPLCSQLQEHFPFVFHPGETSILCLFLTAFTIKKLRAETHTQSAGV